MYTLSDFDFNLPQERIAQFPLPDRSASRLLHLDGEQIIDRQFADIVDLLQPGDLLVMNETRVLKARFYGVKESGGKIEGRRLASIDLPAPGGPFISRLWPPAAVISMTRRALS